jgi:glucose-1-phosphate thymidylyltransferase
MRETCGLLLAGGNGTRLFPLTKVVNKHLLPIYDKPMIYYSLSTLMIAGIKEVAIIVRPEDKTLFERIFKDGKYLGMNINYIVQDSPLGIPQAYILAKSFIDDRNVAMTLGDNIFLGQGLGETFANLTQIKGMKVFAFPVKNPQDYGVIQFEAKTKKIISIEEKPIKPKSNYVIPGIYFSDNSVVALAESLKPSKRGEFEIVDLINIYNSNNLLSVEFFRRGTGWMDAGSPEALYSAGELVSVLQERQGMRFGSPEEIAFRLGWINKKQLEQIAINNGNTSYGKYLLSLLLDATE